MKEFITHQLSITIAILKKNKILILLLFSLFLVIDITLISKASIASFLIRRVSLIGTLLTIFISLKLFYDMFNHYRKIVLNIGHLIFYIVIYFSLLFVFGIIGNVLFRDIINSLLIPWICILIFLTFIVMPLINFSPRLNTKITKLYFTTYYKTIILSAIGVLGFSIILSLLYSVLTSVIPPLYYIKNFLQRGVVFNLILLSYMQTSLIAYCNRKTISKRITKKT